MKGGIYSIDPTGLKRVEEGGIERDLMSFKEDGTRGDPTGLNEN